MPVSRAPVAFTMARNAPRQNTNVITSEASAKPLTGPIKMSLAEAPTTSAISPFSPV